MFDNTNQSIKAEEILQKILNNISTQSHPFKNIDFTDINIDTLCNVLDLIKYCNDNIKQTHQYDTIYDKLAIKLENKFCNKFDELIGNVKPHIIKIEVLHTSYCNDIMFIFNTLCEHIINNCPHISSNIIKLLLDKIILIIDTRFNFESYINNFDGPIHCENIHFISYLLNDLKFFQREIGKTINKYEYLFTQTYRENILSLYRNVCKIVTERNEIAKEKLVEMICEDLEQIEKSTDMTYIQSFILTLEDYFWDFKLWFDVETFKEIHELLEINIIGKKMLQDNEKFTDVFSEFMRKNILLDNKGKFIINNCKV